MPTGTDKEIQLYYLMQPVKHWTFEMPQVKALVEAYCVGKVLNLFAGMTRLNVNEVRVDIERDLAVWDYNMDAREFVNFWHEEDRQDFDTVILDPPYTYRKVKELYGGHRIGSLPRLKDEVRKILSPKARVISLGYDTVGMSRKRGFEKIAIAVICHSGDSKDTLMVVEERI